MKNIVVVIAVITALMLVMRESHARCSHGGDIDMTETNIEENQYKLVFAGYLSEISTINDIREEEYGNRVVEVEYVNFTKVIHLYGEVNENGYKLARARGSRPGMILNRDEYYLIYAVGDNSNFLTAFGCGASRKISREEYELIKEIKNIRDQVND